MSMSIADIAKMHKGNVAKVLDAVLDTTTSAEVNIQGYNSLLVQVYITGSITWNIKLQGRLGATTIDISGLTTGDITASILKAFNGVPDYVKVVATATTPDAIATCTVYVQPYNN